MRFGRAKTVNKNDIFYHLQVYRGNKQRVDGILLRYRGIRARLNRTPCNYVSYGFFYVLFVNIVKRGTNRSVVVAVFCLDQYPHALAAIPTAPVRRGNVTFDDFTRKSFPQRGIVFFCFYRVICRNVHQKPVFSADFYYGNDEKHYYKHDKNNADRITRILVHFIYILEQRKSASQNKRADSANDNREEPRRLFLIGFRRIFFFIFPYGNFIPFRNFICSFFHL